MADIIHPPLSPIRTGLSCRCPRCGKGRLFQGFLGLRPRCEACGLDYSFADSGDGPAVFVIFFAGLIQCPLITRWRPESRHRDRSGLCQSPPYAPQQLFDHFAGACEQQL